MQYVLGTQILSIFAKDLTMAESIEATWRLLHQSD